MERSASSVYVGEHSCVWASSIDVFYLLPTWRRLKPSWRPLLGLGREMAGCTVDRLRKLDSKGDRVAGMLRSLGGEMLECSMYVNISTWWFESSPCAAQRWHHEGSQKQSQVVGSNQYRRLWHKADIELPSHDMYIC